MRLLVVALLALAFSVMAGRPSEAGYASIVIDAATGEVLHEVNADTLNYPASLTKMMTLYLTFDALKEGTLSLDTPISVSEHAAGQPPTRLGLRPGDRIAVVDAILALVTKSANDVASALAEALGGTEWEFGRMMTAKAAELGMSRTSFRNASGLPDLNQVSTARDLAHLAQALIRDHPEYYHYFSTLSFTYEGRTIETHNRFMTSYPGADGIKTGYIRASGFNLAASAERDGRRLIGVVMGGRTARARDRHMADLLDRAFDLGPDAPLVASAQTTDSRDDGADESASDAELQPVAFVPPAARRTTRKGARPVAADTRGTWIVQVGVFSDRSNARRVAQEAADMIRNLPSHTKVGVTVLKRGSGKTLFRARLTGVSRSVAVDACKQLEKRNKDCLALDSDA